jgi:hypothetical protein
MAALMVVESPVTSSADIGRLDTLLEENAPPRLRALQVCRRGQDPRGAGLWTRSVRLSATAATPSTKPRTRHRRVPGHEHLLSVYRHRDAALGHAPLLYRGPARLVALFRGARGGLALYAQQRRAPDPAQLREQHIRWHLARGCDSRKIRRVRGWRRDVVKATTLIGSLDLLNETYEEWYMDRLIAQTLMLVQRHQHEIDLVASELLKRGRLTGRQVRRLLFIDSRHDVWGAAANPVT